MVRDLEPACWKVHSSLIRGKRPWKTGSPRAGVGAHLARMPGGHQTVLGELQDKLHFQRLLKAVLWGSWADLRCRSAWCASEGCAGRNASCESTRLVDAISGTVKNHCGSSSSLLLLELLFEVHRFCRIQLWGGCRHLQGGEMNVFGSLNNKVGKITQNCTSS